MNSKISDREVIKILEEIGILLELKGENPFKSKAYYAAARNIEAVDEDIQTLVSKKTLSSVKGIGSALNKKISELVMTGKMEYYENLKSSIPSGLIDMLKIQGLGTKKIRSLNDQLYIETLAELEYACRENRLMELPGFGRKTQDKILDGISHLKKYSEKHLYADVIDEAQSLLHSIQKNKDVITAYLAGSIRRCNEIVKDIDIVASTTKAINIADYFVSLPQVETIIGKGETKISVILKSGINSDLRLVADEQLPFALHHFTGSKDHNTAMRGRAKKKAIKMNEYGLFKRDNAIPCLNEHEIFSALNLSFIPPELRENMGEIEAAEKGEIPQLIEESEIKGLFHIHTNASDGSDSLESIVSVAKKMDLEYIGISDHSKSAYYAGGLSVEEIRRQHKLIDQINESESDFHIFKGIESDILPDGRLDYDNRLLASFDFVIAAVHSHFNMSEEEMNLRIMKALDNPFTTILAHPSGRLLLSREPYNINISKIIDHAARTNKIIELNANPQRLDLDWRFLKYAKKQGVKIAINPDAHNSMGLHDIKYGINIARKGWLSSFDCINCLNLNKMIKFLSSLKTT